MTRSRARQLVTAAAVLVAGAALAAGLAVPAQAQPKQHSDAAVRALADHLGVTVKQARQRIAADELAGRVVTAAGEAAGRASAGGYIKNGEPVINVTDQGAAERARSAGAEVNLVQTPMTKLTAIKSELDGLAARSGAGSVQSWSIDVRQNKVRVVAAAGPQGEATRAFLDAARDHAAVKVVRTEAVIEPLADLLGGQQIEYGSYLCSAGFNATDSSGNPVLLTAGHCGEGYSTFSSDGVEIGTTSDYTFPGSGDFAQVPITNTYWQPRGAVESGSGEQQVAGAEEAAVGAAICKSGRTTGWTCGTVVSLDNTVNYDNGDGTTATVSGLTQTDACTEGGDSGGPNLSGDQAQGLTSGGAGYDDDGNPMTPPVCGEKVGEQNISFIQPISDPLEAYGLTLQTEGDGNDGPGNDGPGNDGGPSTLTVPGPARDS